MHHKTYNLIRSEDSQVKAQSRWRENYQLQSAISILHVIELAASVLQIEAHKNSKEENAQQTFNNCLCVDDGK